MKKVIDLSKFNPVMDWSKVKAAVDAVVLRLGYRGAHTGTITYDPKYQEYVSACQKLGIPKMIYFFPCSISTAEAEAEANFIISAAKKTDLCGAIWLDSEVVYRDKSGRSDNLSKASRTKYLNVILRKLHAAGYECGVYASASWFAGNLNDSELEPYCLRWVAQWADRCTYTSHSIDMWQYTNTGAIPGIDGRVDISKCYIHIGAGSETKATRKGVTRQDIVDQICSWEGWSESNGKFKKIIDIYNYYLPTAVKTGTLNYPVKYTDEWCATGASVAFIQAGAPELFPIECGCPRTITLAKRMGIWKENDGYIPKPADAILYDWQDSGSGDNQGTADHIGIVIDVDEQAGTFTVMECNKEEAVGRRTMKINGRYIRGFITPKFKDSVPVPAKKEEVKTVAKTYEISKTGTPNKTTCIKWGLLKNNQKVTARLQPEEGAKPCSFSPVQPLSRIEVYDYITTAKRWAYCKVGGKYGYILASSISAYLRTPKQPADKVVDWVLADDFGKKEIRWNALKTLGYDADAVQEKIDAMYGKKKESTDVGPQRVYNLMKPYIDSKTAHKDFIREYNAFIDWYNKKYGTKHSKIDDSNAWCTEFLQLMFYKAGYLDLIGYGKRAKNLMDNAIKRGTWKAGTSDIIYGDIVVYQDSKGNPNHSEFALGGKDFVSGNYNGGVHKRHRSSLRTVKGRIRPKYPKETAENPRILIWAIPPFFEGEQGERLFGDSTAIIQYDANDKPQHVVLIDAGLVKDNGKLKPPIVNKLKTAGITKIDALVLSHAHGDHYGMFSDIFKNFEVKHLYLPSYEGLKALGLSAYVDAIKNQEEKAKKYGAGYTYMTKGEVFRVGQIVCECLFQANYKELANKDGHYAVNSLSPALRFTIGGIWRYHTAGDMQNDANRLMVKAVKDLRADVFKFQWHGDGNAISASLMEAMKPLVAISNYHHKERSGRGGTRRKAEAVGAVVARNWENGDIYLNFQGETMKLSCSKGNLSRTFVKKKLTYKVSLTTKIKSSSGTGLLAIEPEDYTPAEVQALKRAGYTVLAYLSVGSVSDERSYYKQLEKYTLRRLDDWEHERYLNVCEPAVQDWATNQGMRLFNAGYDGLWIDNLDVYEEYPSNTAYNGITRILQALYPHGYIMINGGMEYMLRAISQKAHVAHGVTQEEVFSLITDYSGSGKFGAQIASESLEYQKYIAKALGAGMEAYLLEYTRDPKLKQKIIDYCTASGADYYISEDVDL